MWGGAPGGRPNAQPADVTARLRPDKAAIGAALKKPSPVAPAISAAHGGLILRYSPHIAM
jgi:hypothetical protein